jgi:hypothetical protein
MEGKSIMLIISKELGYPSRPTGGGELPRNFKLYKNEVATPKLDGHRVLMSADGSVFNRHMKPYTYMKDEHRQRIHHALNRQPHAVKVIEEEWVDSEKIDGLLPKGMQDAPPVYWWDIEYIHHGMNEGSAVVIDCVIGESPSWNNYDYHARMKMYQRLPVVFCTSISTYLNCNVWRFPQAGTTLGAITMYDTLKSNWKDHQLCTHHSAHYPWEGIVVQNISEIYELTRKQSQNRMHQVKYRFQ